MYKEILVLFSKRKIERLLKRIFNDIPTEFPILLRIYCIFLFVYNNYGLAPRLIYKLYAIEIFNCVKLYCTAPCTYDLLISWEVYVQFVVVQKGNKVLEDCWGLTNGYFLIYVVLCTYIVHILQKYTLILESDAMVSLKLLSSASFFGVWVKLSVRDNLWGSGRRKGFLGRFADFELFRLKVRFGPNFVIFEIWTRLFYRKDERRTEVFLFRILSISVVIRKGRK